MGEASTAMNYLKERKLDVLIQNLQQPLLGICLGMQLLCTSSEENNTTCLGIFNTTVKKFNTKLKIPQVGWNRFKTTDSPLFNRLSENAYGYFVHSYYAELCEQTIAKTEYGLHFSAALQYKNYYGVQFHPEKSAAPGEQILKNFISI